MVMEETGKLGDVLKGGLAKAKVQWAEGCGRAKKKKDPFSDTFLYWGSYHRKENIKALHMTDWMKNLATACGDTFEVKHYYTRRSGSFDVVRRKNSCLMFVVTSDDHSLQIFYGLLTNSQLAAYSYKIAFTRVHSLILAYNPHNEDGLSGAKLAGFVRTARLDYVRFGVMRRPGVIIFCVHLGRRYCVGSARRSPEAKTAP